MVSFAPISCGSGANDRRLIQCTVEMTRCRLDRTYLEALGAASLSPGEADAGEVEALREEVDSLYAEIFPVVQMSVENQFMRPAERRVRGREARALGNSAVAIDYVRSTLRFLRAPAVLLLITPGYRRRVELTLCLD